MEWPGPSAKDVGSRLRMLSCWGETMYFERFARMASGITVTVHKTPRHQATSISCTVTVIRGDLRPSIKIGERGRERGEK